MIDTDYSKSCVLGNPRSRIARYVPFSTGDDGKWSLTVFCTTDGALGIQVNSEVKRKIGRELDYAYPITHYLDYGEIITSVHVGTRGENIRGPYVFVSTLTHQCRKITGTSLFTDTLYICRLPPAGPCISVYTTHCIVWCMGNKTTYVYPVSRIN